MIKVGQPLILIPGPGEKPLHKYIPEPKQWEFHLADRKNVLIGGVRGTGKSFCMRNDAHFRARAIPGFRYLILRRKYPDLRMSHIVHLDREMEAFGGYFNKTERIAYYPNGSQGFFGHVENDADVENYQGAEFGAIYFDELVTFTFDMFNKISGSARVPKGKGYKPIVRAASNPGGAYEDWVRKLFVEKSADQSQYPGYNPDDYHYIHTIQGDNPYLPDGYYDDLAAGNPHLRRQWALGEWGVQEDGYFPEFKHWTDEEGKEPQPWHVINRLPLVKGAPLLEQPWINIYRAVDYGFAPDPAVCLWIAVLPNKQAIVFKERTWLKTPAEVVAQDIVHESAGMRVIDTFADPSMWIEGRRQTGVSTADTYENNGVALTQAHNDRAAIGRAIHQWLSTVIDGEPQLQIYREGCPNLIRTFPQMRMDENRPERLADGDDHWIMALGYFCMQSDVSPSREFNQKSSLPRWMQRRPHPLSRYAIR